MPGGEKGIIATCLEKLGSGQFFFCKARRAGQWVSNLWQWCPKFESPHIKLQTHESAWKVISCSANHPPQQMELLWGHIQLRRSPASGKRWNALVAHLLVRNNQQVLKSDTSKQLPFQAAWTWHRQQTRQNMTWKKYWTIFEYQKYRFKTDFCCWCGEVAFKLSHVPWAGNCPLTWPMAWPRNSMWQMCVW